MGVFAQVSQHLGGDELLDGLVGDAHLGVTIKSLAVDPRRVKTNFRREAKLVVAELLHLCLQRQGYAGTHELVNKTIVPAAAAKGISLPLAMRYHLQSHPDKKLEQAWRLTPASSLKLLKRPGKYIGRAIELAKAEAKNKLEME